MSYSKMSVKRQIAFVLVLFVALSGTNLSLNSAARAARSTNLRAPAPPSLSPPTRPGTNGKIAFTSMRDGNWEIYTMNPDGSNQVNLTRNAARDFAPAWSPDGTKIAFASEREGQMPGNIYVMNADGNNVTRITSYEQGGVIVGAPRVINPTWSPDGTKLAFVMSNPGITSSLIVVNADGSGVLRTLTTFKDGGAFEWSPDGTRIAFTAADFRFYSPEEGLLYFLFVINADGSGKTRIGDFPGGDKSNSWPPVYSGPTWSPDGTSIAYAYDTSSPYINQSPKRFGDIAVVSATGGDYKFLTNTPATEMQPSWSPDGSRIAFTSDRDGHNEIYVMNADGSQHVRLTNNGGGNFDPTWQTLNHTGPLAPTQSIIQFSTPHSRLIEPYYNGGTYTDDPLTVTRLGDISQEATVDYTTSDASGLTPCSQTNTGLASSRCDYVTTSGTLRFAPGEASKAISVSLVDDAYTESNESFNVLLSNPTGGALGVNRTATVTIPANDIPLPGSPMVPSNPINGKYFFVRQHYLDFLNREPELNGITGWLNILNNCPQNDTRCDMIEVSSAFFRSAEFADRGYFVFRFYSAALGRTPRYAEFMPDLRRVSGFQTDQQLETSKIAFIEEFMRRQEFKTKYDQTEGDATAYVDAILNAANVTLPQRQALIDDLQAGRKTRAEVLRAVAETAEVYQKYYNTAFVVMQYFGYLRRDPDILYLEWIKTMDRTGDYRTMINGFMNSTEYRQRFGP
ncbi:MAG TPA: DPP IV N-terminal domain-containing protein [Pyrinomonadaceae bacterium]